MTEVPSDRLIRARIFLSAIKSRRAAAAVLFTVAVLAIAAAAIGPMFMQSADTSVLTSTASAAIPGQSDLTIISNGGAVQLSKLSTAVRAADRLSDGLLSRTIYAVDVGSFFSEKGQGFGADVFARTDICEHLKIIRGACPTQMNGVAMSERSAVAAHLHVGSHVRIGAAHSPTTIDLTISAIYQPPPTVDNNYWKDNYYFVFGTGTGPSTQLDPFIASFATALATSAMATPQLEADLAWRPGATLSGATALESTASKIKSLLFTHFDLASSSGLGSVLAAAHHDDDLMSAVVLALVLQLILLSLLILYTLGRSTILGRRQEADFARRHGFPRGALIALAIGEPASLIVAALPVGVLVAWLTLLALTRTVFVTGTPVSFSVLAIVCAAGACLAGVVAMAVASSELWRSRSANSRQVKIIGLAVDAFALALALTGLLSLATKGSLNGVQANPLASLAPGLLALGAGVIGLRLAALAIGAIIRRTGESTRVAPFLALRQVGRRPSVLRQVLPLTTATVVLLFAVGSFFLAASNRSLIANVEVGSARVVDVNPPPGLNFEAAVRRADPTGHEAMAAAYYSSATGTLLAVDSSRFASVASWPPSLSSKSIAVLAKKLSPPVPSGVNFTGDELRLTLDVEKGSPAMELGVDFFDETYNDSEITNVAPVVAGLHTYDVALNGECTSSCRLTSLAPIWINPYAKYSRGVQIILRNVAEHVGGHWHTIAFGAGQRGTWDVQPRPAHVATTKGTCCDVTFDLPPHILGFGGVQLIPVDLPAGLPAIVTKGSETFDPPTPPSGEISAEGLDGAPVTLQPVATVPTLPLIGQNGTLVDLSFAQRAILNPETYTTFQVWLTASASPKILQRLRADGVTIGPATRASTRLRELNHGGVALAYTVALLVSPIAALLAIGTMTFVIVSDGRRRRNEITSLSMTGVPTRTMRRALLYENAVVLGVALVVGTIVGFIADSLALSSLPQFSAGSGGVPLPTAVPITPFFCAVGALALLLAGAVELATRSILHGARSRRDNRSSP
jgi:putative ABC transport system permease protein